MYRIFIKKKLDLDNERLELLKEFREYLEIKSLEDIKIINVYDILRASKEEKDIILNKIIYEPMTDKIIEGFHLEENQVAFRVKDLKGQFNKREHFTNKFIQLVFPDQDIEVKTSKIIVAQGINQEELDLIKDYYINPIEIKELAIEDRKVERIEENQEGIIYLQGFINYSRKKIEDFKKDYQIGIDMEDLLFVQDYFQSLDRDPSLTEIKLIDTYWSDHCRHTTFNTRINKIEIQDSQYKEIFEREIQRYISSRDYVYGDRDKAISLMDLGTINMKELSKKGLLEDKEDTEEINAASIEIDVDIDGETEEWLLMFKNETHNHPTEIEPFGGAGTCLGGAIRDPLSGRSFIYQAMRISGGKDPREKFQDTLKGKLAQRKLSRRSMEGYSSYGNEIGVSTGFVREIYDEGYLAKRFECGALLAAAPRENVYRGSPSPGDKIVLVGGRTGRDGLGGAVGSSQKHSEDSLDQGGAEVQKGNPSLERKIMRLFRKPEFSRLIKLSNDFGAGGLGVAVGELADGVRVYLDQVPLKYPGLSPREIALSESQERMACLIDEKDLEDFLAQAKKEDLEASLVAEVIEDRRLEFIYQGEKLVDIERDFLATNGLEKNIDIKLPSPEGDNPFESKVERKDLEGEIVDKLGDINIGSQKGLIENFDNSVSGGSVVMPYGGSYMLSPSEGMVGKIPVEDGYTNTSSIMTYGYDPGISKWSPYHGGYYAVIESIAKVVALGGDYRNIRFSFQEYFERLGEDQEKWGRPFLALLGAYTIQKDLDLASIGGKDSMSGSFEDISVLPTFVSFAVTKEDVKNIRTSEFKRRDSRLVLVDLDLDENYLIDSKDMAEKYRQVYELNKKGLILSASTVKNGGIIRSIGEMSFGNKIGCKLENIDPKLLLQPKYGCLILELKEDIDIGNFPGFKLIGRTIEEEEILVDGLRLDLDKLLASWESPLEGVFPSLKGKLQDERDYENIRKRLGENQDKNKETTYRLGRRIGKARSITRPKVLIPVFTGSHGEYSLKKSFKDAGSQVETLVIKSLDPKTLSGSIREFSRRLKESQILALPHGLSFSGEPAGTGKFGAYILSRPEIKEALAYFLDKREGLILGIGEGFQILLKTGLIGGKNGILAANREPGFISSFADIEVVDNNSPWFNAMEKGDIYSAPLGHYEGRLTLDRDKDLDNIRIASKFVNQNPTASLGNIESLTNSDGRILGTTASIDRIGKDLYKNIDIKGYHKIFQSAINYFK